MDSTERDAREARLGVLYGIAAYSIWGFSVVYWKMLLSAGALEVLAHRVVWASVIIGTVLVLRKRTPHILAMMRDFRLMRLLVITGALLAVNWTIFVWAVLTDQVLQASLGYYINPMVNVLIGTILLKESMSRLQIWSVALAGLGVLAMLVIGGSLPWPALTLAVTFAIYAYLRKTSNVVALDALFIEMTLFVPVALGVLIWLGASGDTVFGPSNLLLSALLICGGLVTFLPLAFFGESVRRVRLITVGFLQYIAPTFQFLLAVFIYGEAFSAGHVAAFGCIWAGLVLFSFDALRRAA